MRLKSSSSAALAGVIGLAACFGGGDAPAAPPDASVADRGDFVIDEPGGPVATRIVVPAAARAVPEVGERLIAQAEARRTEMMRRAAGLQAERPDRFTPMELEVAWSVAYAGLGVISLLGETIEREGRAAPRVTFQSVLYDQSAGREVGFADLFADPRPGGAAMTAVADAAFAAWASASPHVGADLALVDERTLRDARDALRPRASSFPRFVLERGDGRTDRIAGVRLYYPAGALGPASDGEYRLFVPAVALEPHLKPVWAARFRGEGA